MSKPFIHEEFLLDTPQARTLYHEHAESLPIIDYHCHLPPDEVAENKTWENMAQVWLYGDHYKWRAMRSNGIDERRCTGDASDREKFDAFAETMPYLLRNPLYHWSQLELKRYFGVDDLLSPETADSIWGATKEKLADPSLSARGLMQQSDVRVVCTTDDPTDSLEYHKAVAADRSFDIKVLPTWRPDKGMAVASPEPFNAWVDKLASVADTDIVSYQDYLEALHKRHDFFAENGCKLSDHGVSAFPVKSCTSDQAASIFDRIRAGTTLEADEVEAFQSAILVEFGIMDAEKEWTQQLHISAMRNNSTKRFETLGPDTGFDSMGDWPVAEGISRFMDALDRQDRLPKTILYSLNPRDNEVLASMLGNFQDGSVPGKIQLGSGWWFNDQIDGMLRQMEALSSMGLLSRFVGMLTDSRSFLSYTRHEYFRRLLCNLLGQEMERGVIPDDTALVGRMVADISYHNAARYFGFME